MSNNILNYKEPLENSLKLDAWHELQEIEHLYQRTFSKSRVTFYLFFLIICGLCGSFWLNLFSLPIHYFMSVCLSIFVFSLMVQIFYLKKAFFWKDKAHYLKRYIKNLPQNSDKQYSPFSLKETTHEPLLTNAILKRSFKNIFFLITNVSLLAFILYTVYQAW